MNGIKENREDRGLWKMYAPHLWALGAILSVSVLFTWLSPKRREVPTDLQGTWTTTEVNHRDRFVEISDVTVSFGTGQGTLSTEFIKKVEEVSEGGEMLYVITCSGDDGESKLWLLYDPASRVLRFRNQERVAWVKSGDA